MSKWILVLVLIAIAMSTDASAITVSVSADNSGMTTTYETSTTDFVAHDITIDNGWLSNHQYGTGGVTKDVYAGGNTVHSHFDVTPRSSGTTEYWSDFDTSSSQIQMWLVVKNAKIINAYSKAISGPAYAYSQAYINSPSLPANLDCYSTAYIASGAHSYQKAAPGTGTANAPDNDGGLTIPALSTSSDSVTFIESSNDGTGDKAGSSFVAKTAAVPYEGRADTSGNAASVQIYPDGMPGTVSGSSTGIQLSSSSGTNTSLTYASSTGGSVGQISSKMLSGSASARSGIAQTSINNVQLIGNVVDMASQEYDGLGSIAHAPGLQAAPCSLAAPALKAIQPVPW